MRVERVRNFFTPAECAALNEWADIGVAKGWLSAGVNDKSCTPYAGRATSRMYGDRFEYPQLVHELADRVRKFCGVDSYPLILDNHGRDGVVVSCTFPGGEAYEHLDPRSAAENTPTLRCNVMTRGPEAGGVLHIEGVPIDIEVGELHCYLVSEHRHHVSTVEGNVPRVMWMFGAQVPADDWNSGKIQLGRTQ